MTDKTIKTYYKWLSLLTLTVSIVGTITLVSGTAIEKLGIGALINLQFHMVFQFLSKIPFGMYTVVENDNTWKRRLVPKVLKVFSVFTMFGAVVAFIGMLKSVSESSVQSVDCYDDVFSNVSRRSFVKLETTADLIRSTTL